MLDNDLQNTVINIKLLNHVAPLKLIKNKSYLNKDFLLWN